MENDKKNVNLKLYIFYKLTYNYIKIHSFVKKNAG